MANKTTKKHFKTFTEEARYWVGVFGLVDWDIDFYHSEGNDELACCGAEPEGRCARIDLNTNWPEGIEITDRSLKMAAFHEVCELLFYPLCSLAKDRYISEVAIETEKHAIIRTLENVLFRNA